jgi:L-lactate dehydrogenase complex protein LldE
MKVRLMLTCLCDAFYGEVGLATVKVLRAAGCEVEFPSDQTCCGQPPFNSGDWEAARRIGNHCVRVLASDLAVAVVTPSSSCAATVRKGYPLLGVEAPEIYELCEFLVRRLGVRKWPPTESGQSAQTLAYHAACHGRALGLAGEAELLLASIPGVRLVPLAEAEQCCGFGGHFSETHPTLSSRIGLEKLQRVVDAGTDTLVSGDMGCLMHLDGLIRREGLPIRVRHVAEILAEVLSA